jgi:hypothetical protein
MGKRIIDYDTSKTSVVWARLPLRSNRRHALSVAHLRFHQIRDEHLERRIFNHKLKKTKKIANGAVTLDCVLALLAPVHRWSCRGPISGASGPRAACTPSPSRSASTLAAERRGESRMRRERGEDKKRERN